MFSRKKKYIVVITKFRQISILFRVILLKRNFEFFVKLFVARKLQKYGTTGNFKFFSCLVCNMPFGDQNNATQFFCEDFFLVDASLKYGRL